jgi:hypothetical protein
MENNIRKVTKKKVTCSSKLPEITVVITVDFQAKKVLHKFAFKNDRNSNS